MELVDLIFTGSPGILVHPFGMLSIQWGAMILQDHFLKLEKWMAFGEDIAVYAANLLLQYSAVCMFESVVAYGFYLYS